VPLSEKTYLLNLGNYKQLPRFCILPSPFLLESSISLNSKNGRLSKDESIPSGSSEQDRMTLRCSAATPAPSVRSGRRRLGSRAHGRLWRFVVRARPFARIAPGRRLSGRDTGGLAALPPAPTPSSAPGPSPSLRSHTCAPGGPARLRG